MVEFWQALVRWFFSSLAGAGGVVAAVAVAAVAVAAVGGAVLSRSLRFLRSGRMSPETSPI